MAVLEIDGGDTPASIKDLDPEVPKTIGGFRIRNPFGEEFRFEPPIPTDLFDLPEITIKVLLGDLLKSVMDFLTQSPFLLKIIEFAAHVLECITAIPDAITSLNPQPIVDCLVGLAEIVDDLLGVIIKIPLMVSDIICVLGKIIDAFIAILQDILQEIQDLLQIQITIDLSDLDILKKVKEEKEKQLAGKEKAVCVQISPLKDLMDILNTLMALAGAGEVPTLEFTAGISLQEQIDQLQVFRDALGALPDTCLITDCD